MAATGTRHRGIGRAKAALLPSVVRRDVIASAHTVRAIGCSHISQKRMEPWKPPNCTAGV